jgi:hypothetical protein
MSLLPIVREGDPRLRQKSTKIRQADDALRKLAADMHETMDAAPGVGLAAPQIGVNRRLIVVHKPADPEEPGDKDVRLTILNPEIVRRRVTTSTWRGASASRVGSGRSGGPGRSPSRGRTWTTRTSGSKPRATWPGSSSTRSTTSTGCCSWT